MTRIAIAVVAVCALSSSGFADATRISIGDAPKAWAAQAAAAEKEAVGTSPGGNAAARFKEGDIFALPMTMKANTCYIAIATSEGGIKEVDLQLIAENPPLPPVVIVADKTTGPTATFGGPSDTRGCVSSPLAGPVKLLVKATAGAGTIVVGVYTKKK